MMYSFSILLSFILSYLSVTFAQLPQLPDIDDNLLNTLIQPNGGWMSNTVENLGLVSESPSISPSPSASSSISPSPSASMEPIPSSSSSPSPSPDLLVEIPSSSPSPSSESRRRTGPTKAPPSTSPTPSPSPASLARIQERKRSTCLRNAHRPCGIMRLENYPDPGEPEKTCPVCTMGRNLIGDPITEIESLPGLFGLVIKPILECEYGAETIVRIACDSKKKKTDCHAAGGGYFFQIIIITSQVRVSRKLAAQVFLAIKERSEELFGEKKKKKKCKKEDSECKKPKKPGCRNGFDCIRRTVRQGLVDWNTFAANYVDSLCGENFIAVEWQGVPVNPFKPMKENIV